MFYFFWCASGLTGAANRSSMSFIRRVGANVVEQFHVAADCSYDEMDAAFAGRDAA